MRHVIIHHGDWDGIVSAWVCKQALQGQEKVAEEDIEVYGIQHNQPFAVDFTGATVWILDFFYPPEAFWTIFETAAKVTMIDHHIKALEKWAKAHEQYLRDDGVFEHRVQENVDIYIQDGVAGCMLTWQWFYQDEEPPMLVEYAADHDLWKFELPDSHEVRAIMRSYKQSLESCDILDAKLEGREGSWNEMIAEGQAIIRYQDGLVETACRHAEQFEIAGTLCLGTQMALDGLISLVAGQLAETAVEDSKGLFGLCWFKARGGKYVYSLRSRGDFDVGTLADKMGGGGHTNAAGFSCETPPTEFLAEVVEARRRDT
jgi:oligoribonuclease NrnB/cAMP/cGMP phosphodiesterase (DHH superfamily)